MKIIDFGYDGADFKFISLVDRFQKISLWIDQMMLNGQNPNVNPVLRSHNIQRGYLMYEMLEILKKQRVLDVVPPPPDPKKKEPAPKPEKPEEVNAVLFKHKDKVS